MRLSGSHFWGVCERADSGVSLACLISFIMGETATCGGWWKKRRGNGRKLTTRFNRFTLCVSVRLNGKITRWFAPAKDKGISHLGHCQRNQESPNMAHWTRPALFPPVLCQALHSESPSPPSALEPLSAGNTFAWESTRCPIKFSSRAQI